MNILLNDNLKKEIKEYALSNVEEEVCALVLDYNKQLNLFKCKNISFHRENNALLDPIDYIRASKLGKIVAHFHSHPSEDKPSFTDYLNAINHNIYSIIFSIKSDKFYIIEPKLKDYLNLTYKCGQNDCYSLVRNYFNQELNIILNDYNRTDKWWKENPNLILDNFKKEGGIEIDYKDIKVNDLILFRLNKSPSHFSIYLGGGMILHHPYGGTSIISEVNDSLIKRIYMVIRHKDLI